MRGYTKKTVGCTKKALIILLTLVLVYTGVSVSFVKPKAAGGSTEMVNRPKITFPGNETDFRGMALTDPAIGMTVKGGPYNKDWGLYNNAKIITDADQNGGKTIGFDTYIPNGNLITTPQKEVNTGGFATSTQKYDIAHNDFEISYIVYRSRFNKPDYGTTFAFHNDPNYVPGKYNGQGSLGIYGFAENPTEYHTLKNAIAAELDGRDQNSVLPGTSGIKAAIDPRKYGEENNVYAGTHIAITKPEAAVKSTPENTGIDYIKVYADKYLEYSVHEAGFPAERTWFVDRYSLMNVKWTLTDPGPTDSLNDNYYTMLVTYTHSTDENGRSKVICKDGPNKGEPLKMQVAYTFSYQEMIERFGGNEVYIGFSGSMELLGANAFYFPTKFPYIVKHLYYNEYEGIDALNAVKLPGLTDPDPYTGDKYYAPYGTVDLYSKIKNFDDYVFVSAYNQTMNRPIKNNKLTQAVHNDAHEIYHMYYTKKIIENPTVETKGGYRRIVFDPTSEGKLGSNALGAVKTFDARQEITWQDAWSKMSLTVPVPSYKDDSKVFAGWTPVFPSDETKIGNVQPGTNPIRFEATYKDVLIEDPTTPNPPKGYKRITFDPTADGRIKNGELGAKKTFDVLSSDTITWSDIWKRIENKTKANYKSNDKIFDKWKPALPEGTSKTSALEATKTFVASYKLNPEIPVGVKLDDRKIQVLLLVVASVGNLSLIVHKIHKKKSRGIVN